MHWAFLGSVFLSHHCTHPRASGICFGVGGGGIWKQVEKTTFWLPFFLAKIKSPLLDTHHILGTGLGHLLALFPFRKDGIGSVFISKSHEHLGQGWASIGTNNQPNLTIEGRAGRLQ